MTAMTKRSESNAQWAMKQKGSWFRWYEPGTSTEEKRVINKLDLFILSYTCLTFFVKYLDQTNVTNAYVSGMSDDLHLTGNELNWFTTYFNIGVIVGAPVLTLMLTVVPPRVCLPFCTSVWSLFVLFIYKAQTAQTIYALRFFAGLFEAGALPGAFYLIGSWYRKSEISRRSTIFMFSSVVGQMLSGYIQAGLVGHMNGRLGVAAWRWLFILDFIIGIPIILFGICCCPDEPKAKRIWWMTECERQICIKRIEDEGRDSVGELDLSLIKRVLISWQFWGFSLAWSCMELTCGVNLQRWITLFLKSVKVDGHRKYSLVLVNSLPTVVGCTELFWMVLAGTAADILRNRPLVILVLGSVQVFCYAVLVVFPSNDTFVLAIYYIASAYGAIAPLLSSWLNTVCGGDKQVRALSTAFMISIGYAVETVAQQKMFPVSQAPAFKETHGYVFGLVWAVVMVIFSCAILPAIERSMVKRGKTDVPGSESG